MTGISTMLGDIVNEQAKNHEVYVVAYHSHCEQSILDELSARVRVIYIAKRKREHRYHKWLIMKLNWRLFWLRADVVHIQTMKLCRAILPIVGRRQFLTVHGLCLPVERVWKGVNLIAVSDAVKEDIQSRCSLRVRTIADGINIGAIAQREPKPFCGTMRIVQVARLEFSKKGQDILIDALARLKQKGLENIEVDFIGAEVTPGELDVLQRQAVELGVAERVHFLGLRDRDYVYSHLKDYDLMCHPSRCEGFGLAIAESMAAMLPVLVPDQGGPYEVIGCGRFGYTFGMEDVESCASKIEYIYHHYQEALAITTPALERIQGCYSMERMVAEYLAYYKSTM